MPISCGTGSRIRSRVPQDIVSGSIDAGGRFCLRSLQGSRLGVGAPAGDLPGAWGRGFSHGLPGSFPGDPKYSRIGYIALGRVHLCTQARRCRGSPEVISGVSRFSPGCGDVRGSYLPQDRISPAGAWYCLKRKALFWLVILPAPGRW